MTAMQLILIRHGLPETIINEDGTPADPPLCELGHAQAVRMAEWLHGESIDRIYSSPLLRAHQTALPLAERLGLEIELEERVVEYDGAADWYMPLEDLKRTNYEAWLDFMRRGYPEGMDPTEFHHRVRDCMEEIVAKNPGRTVTVVCHGGVINAWASHVLGMGYKPFFSPGYTSIHRFIAARSGERSLESLNERAHLRGL